MALINLAQTNQMSVFTYTILATENAVRLREKGRQDPKLIYGYQKVSFLIHPEI